MSRRVCLYLVGSFVLIALAGCGGGWFMQQREPWRHEAEVACLQSGQIKISPAVAQMPAISGPGICGADFPLKVVALGEISALGFAEELRPPGLIPQYRQRPAASPAYGAYPQPSDHGPYPPPPRAASPADPGPPLLLTPPGSDDGEEEPYAPPGPGRSHVSRPAPLPEPSYPTRPYSTREGPYDPPASQPPEPYYTPPPRPYGAPPYGSRPGRPAEPFRPRQERESYELPSARGAEPLPPLGPPDPAAASGPATIVPPATLACPMVSALDNWVSTAVQPAALRWFGQPVAEIKQISAYSCRGMNGNPRANISEHAFGNALDVAAFTLADGRKVTVKDGWRGLPEERGFLRDVHAGACQQFSTVLGPGSNIYHYNHLHLDLMRRSSGRAICNPAAVPGDLVAGRRGDDLVTGAIGRTRAKPAPGPSREERRGGSLSTAVAGED